MLTSHQIERLREMAVCEAQSTLTDEQVEYWFYRGYGEIEPPRLKRLDVSVDLGIEDPTDDQLVEATRIFRDAFYDALSRGVQAVRKGFHTALTSDIKTESCDARDELMSAAADACDP